VTSWEPIDAPLADTEDEIGVDDEVVDLTELDEAADEARAAAWAEFGDLDSQTLPDSGAAQPGVPVVAIIGRPNVGKSTLVNRIIGRREAVVEDVPGVTRDRVTYPAEWNGRSFLLMDTGGWERKARGFAQLIASQAERAAAESDLVLFVVDAQVGATDTDEAIVRVLRQAGVPVLLVANKADGANEALAANELWGLGLGEPYPVSALQGRGSGDLLDAVVKMLPEQGQGRSRTDGPSRVALLGKPNVGKSSLLNALAHAERVVVDSRAGTTVDPVDELITLDGEPWWFVDTAGIRRRGGQSQGHEYYATLRTAAALDRSDIAIVLLDASQPLTEQDLRIITMVVEAGRGLVLAFNKWDLVDEDRRYYLDREIDRELATVTWAPRVNVSAMTGRHIARLRPALDEARTGWQTRISTGRFNQFLNDMHQAHPHPLRGGRQPRILYGAQVSVGPPTFVVFTTGFLEAGYRRFMERRLREEFGFTGTPLRIHMRLRTRRTR